MPGCFRIMQQAQDEPHHQRVQARIHFVDHQYLAVFQRIQNGTDV
jgi:hypothetical protein